MSNGRAFRVSRRRAENNQPVPFDIILEVPDPEDPDNEERFIEQPHSFRAKRRVPGALLLDVAASGTEEGQYQAAALKLFFEEIVVPEDKERLQTLLRESDPPIEMETLSEIADYLLTEVSDHPTE